MPEPVIAIDGYTIVLLGSFNPAIFHPLWFEREGLLPKGEAEAAEARLEICTPQVSIFDTEWLRLEVMNERFSGRTKDPSQTDPLRDLVVGTFELLSHSPISAVGLNAHYVYKPASARELHHIGHALAPKDVWQGVMTLPGLRTMVVEDPYLSKECPGKVRIEVIARQDSFVGININNHFDINEKLASAAVATIKSSWTGFLERSSKGAQTLLGNLLGKPISTIDESITDAVAKLGGKTYGRD